MTASTFAIGISALSTAQHGLTTTGHNIANVNTAGFSRQRVAFETLEPQFIGVGYIGKGVITQGVHRLADQFLIDQVRNSVSSEARAAKMTELLDQIDRQFGAGLLANGMQDFFDGIGDANDDPRLMATRQVLIERAQTMLNRFQDQEAQLNAAARSANQQMTGVVAEINTLTQALAAINADIGARPGVSNGDIPNDLFDQRDQLLQQLGEKVGVQIQHREDNMVNVLIGDGQLVVSGAVQSRLTTVPNALDGTRTEIGIEVGNTVAQVTSSISGGQLGALVDFRDGALEPARNAVGRLGATIALTMNAQHREGMDLNGVLGGDLFNVPAPNVNPLGTNSGTITVAHDTANIGALTVSDYRLRHDGTNFTLTRLADNTTTTLAGAGPFSVDGMTITLGTAPAAGDEYLLQPTKLVPRGLSLATTDPAGLALAAPVRTETAISNIGEATIGSPEVLDATDAALLDPVQLVFNDPPTTYQVNGAGPLLPYTSGADIDLNGWRVQISGAPEAGDTFSISSNAGGIGDNNNGLALGALQFTPLLENGSASYQEAYGIAVGKIGAATNESQITLGALSVLTENAQAARDSLSAVNLDEEAANLLRFQQAYQAAAQVIAAADNMFQLLLDAAGN